MKSFFLRKIFFLRTILLYDVSFKNPFFLLYFFRFFHNSNAGKVTVISVPMPSAL